MFADPIHSAALVSHYQCRIDEESVRVVPANLVAIDDGDQSEGFAVGPVLPLPEPQHCTGLMGAPPVR